MNTRQQLRLAKITGNLFEWNWIMLGKGARALFFRLQPTSEFIE